MPNQIKQNEIFYKIYLNIIQKFYYIKIYNNEEDFYFVGGTYHFE